MKAWYRYINKLDKNKEMLFLNYGYYDETEKIYLKKEDERERYSLQLYHHVVSSVELNGLDILEVGCGRGGGASYIKKYFNPKSVTGIDLCKAAISFCRQHYLLERLSFIVMDAHNLLFNDNSFDVVINIESSHRYANMDKFLSEVYRVLKSGGFFLFADFRYKKLIDPLFKQLINAGFHEIRKEIISEQVIKALEADEKRRINLIKKGLPTFLHKVGQEFSGTKETRLYKSFINRRREYICTILQK